MDPRVLVVESDPEARARYRAWFEGAGMWVMTCPGPSSRGDGCPVFREERCELVGAVDVVVIDTALEGREPVGRGLAVEYAASGVPVLALTDERHAKGSGHELALLPRRAGRRRVVRAVRRLLPV